MLKNYFKTAIRNLLKEKASSLINIAGLSLGITSCLILFLILKDGASYDKYHTHYERIFRVVSKSKDNGRDTFTQGIPPALPEAFKNDFREAEEVVFTSYRRNSIIAIEQTDGTFKKFEEPTGLVITTPAFFKIFDRNMIIGDALKRLDDPNEAIISRKWALRYFGKVDAVGELVRYEDNDYRITAVMDDYPSTTDLPFDLMLSYSTVKKAFDEKGWGNVSDADNCYFLLREGESIDNMRSHVASFRKKYLGDDDNAAEKTYILQPLKDVHTDTRFGNYNKKMPPEAKITLTVIGVFLLIMACINFINLTTAEAMKRTKEVGVRKVLGSSQLQLIIKFVGETFIITFIAMLISLCITELALRSVNSFLDISLSLDLNDSRLWLFLIVLMVLVSILSGLYPAIVTARFKPVQVLKGQLRITGHSRFSLRRGMVATQFFISQLFIIGAIVLVRQMDFMEEQYLGFRQDAIISVPIPVREGLSPVSRMRALKNEILRLEGVEEASLNSSPPSSAGVMSTGFKLLEKNEELSTQVKLVDGDYISLFDIELLSGEPLSDLDTMTGFVVNEKLVKTAGYESNEAIIGKMIDFWGKQIPVKGVVKDYNTRSLTKPMEPVIMVNDKKSYTNLSIRLKPVNMQGSILAIQKLWEAAYPEHMFKYDFLDQQISHLYRGERKMSTLITTFAFIAVFIGCLGLFGLVSFMANQRSKEIGIRKVLGASVNNIIVLFSGEFAKLITIGFVLAVPISVFFLDKILQEFAYRIHLGPLIFLASLAITFFIAMATVGLRAFKAASINPVNSLRSE
ncbi:ABC transporter permease [Fulvivirgaceae bacterium PWU4]|uniref:ABC transporter permease n=1 Tax=Chryseosolibacter histidini TaxID=2782349 RepID=A0AAP2GS87_9BACT|nr:ABC transporter permease [Chryseosolibacter histidini]MBT1700870.1 ABC transporter permease [Chryseosolibacter histidini]